MTGTLTAQADVHNHLVPGVDDGARTLDDVLDAVGRMAALGIRRIITTPHLDGSITPHPRHLEVRLDEVSRAFDTAAEALGRSFPDVEFRRGHEIMLDVPDVRFDDPRVRMAGTSFVLVEWPRLQIPPGTVKVLKRIVADGYRPIVAHPERYIGMDRSLELAGQWREAGAYLQVNYGSVDGRYGADARSAALRLLRRGWVDYLASDFHGGARREIYHAEAWRRVQDLGGVEALLLLCQTNPVRIFEDEAPLPVPPLPSERGFWAKIKDAFNLESS